MEAELRSHLVALAGLYAAHHKLELVTVARQAAGDWRFFERIESGSSFTARKYDMTLAWFSENWPAEVEWPADVPRPQQAAA